MLHLDKYMIAFFVILLCVMGYLMMSDRQTTVSVGRLGEPVPEFSLQDLSQTTTYEARDLLGEWTLMNVWASWCAPCKKEHEVLMDLSKRNIRIVGVNFKDELSAANAFLEVRGNPFAFIVADQQGKFGFDLGVYGVPETLLIDPQGVIQHRYPGILTKEVFEEQFLPLMSEQ